MTLLHRSRLIAQRLGLDFARYPYASPDFQAFRAFTSVEPDVIVDVGANDGGFARQCRQFGYEGQIVSFEPGSEAFDRLECAAKGDLLWSVHKMGLGDRSGQSILHVAGNEGASSSLLPMLAAHETAAPEARFVADESVPIRRLDEWFADQAASWERVALKVDTQGFEQQVLKGAGDLLDGRIVSVQLELSLVHLYGGSWLWDEAVAWIGQCGFVLAGLTPGFSDVESGRLLQFDGVFLKSSA